jgi:hypothetical protein
MATIIRRASLRTIPRAPVSPSQLTYNRRDAGRFATASAPSVKLQDAYPYYLASKPVFANKVPRCVRTANGLRSLSLTRAQDLAVTDKYTNEAWLVAMALGR